MSEKEVKENWKQHWTTDSSIEDSATWVGKYLRKKRLEITKEMLRPLDKLLSVIDMGCGGGRTLTALRNAGFQNSIGIDYVEASLVCCEEKGFKIDKDVFLVDAKQTPYPDRHFGLVFSEGLWEHFLDPVPFIQEAARIADRYILIIQPDHFTLFGRLMKIGWDLFTSNKGGVKEYSFRLSYFQDELRRLGFTLVSKKTTSLGEQAVMLFERLP